MTALRDLRSGRRCSWAPPPTQPCRCAPMTRTLGQFTPWSSLTARRRKRAATALHSRKKARRERLQPQRLYPRASSKCLQPKQLPVVALFPGRAPSRWTGRREANRLPPPPLQATLVRCATSMRRSLSTTHSCAPGQAQQQNLQINQL